MVWLCMLIGLSSKSSADFSSNSTCQYTYNLLDWVYEEKWEFFVFKRVLWTSWWKELTLNLQLLERFAKPEVGVWTHPLQSVVFGSWRPELQRFCFWDLVLFGERFSLSSKKLYCRVNHDKKIFIPNCAISSVLFLDWTCLCV